MAKPILLSVDDDSDVLRAIERDLRSQYGAEYRVIGSDSPEGALDLLKQLKVRNDSVALLLADQRMPRMDGVEFLQEAMGIFPGAKRALLTAYADTNAAITAINNASINYFFLKPWDPPAEHLYPQLDDLLDDWQASYHPTFQGIRVLGTRWSPRSYELRDFLARNRVPYQWIDVEASANDPETKRLLEALGPEAANLPVVLFPDGTKLLESVPEETATQREHLWAKVPDAEARCGPATRRACRGFVNICSLRKMIEGEKAVSRSKSQEKRPLSLS
jgi:thioredoxin reductase (NADPH)